MKLPDWQRQRIADRLATGGAIVSLRQRGYRWDDLAAAFNLGDGHEAKTLAAHYLLASAGPRETAQDAREGDPLPDDHPPDAA